MSGDERGASPGPAVEPADRAFEQFSVLWRAALLSYARTLAPPRDEPEDLVQDALERAWTGRADRLLADPLPWLRAIVLNRARDAWRRELRIRFEPLGDDERLADPDHGPPASAEGERKTRIRGALRRLPEEERAALVLHHAEGWSVADLAELFTVSAPAIRKRLQRGRERLLAVLETAPAQFDDDAQPAPCRDARRDAVAYVDGGLTAAERSALEAHLRHCDACPPVLGALQVIAEALARPAASHDGGVTGARPRSVLISEIDGAVRAQDGRPLVIVVGAGPGGLTAARRLVERGGSRLRVRLIVPSATAIHLGGTVDAALGQTRRSDVVIPLDLPGVEIVEGHASVDGAGRVTVGAETVAPDGVIAAPGLWPDVDAVPGAPGVTAAWDPIAAEGWASSRDQGAGVAVVVAALPYRCPPAPYGLAMRLAAASPGNTVTLYTPEPRPLAGVGGDAPETIARLARAAGVRLRTGVTVDLGRLKDGVIQGADADSEAQPYDRAFVIPPHRRAPGFESLTGKGPLVTVRDLSGRVSERLWVIGDAADTPLPRAAGVATTQAVNAADALLAALDLAAAPPPKLPEPSCWLWTSAEEALRISIRFDGGLPPAGLRTVQLLGPSRRLGEEARRSGEELARLAGAADA